MRFTIDSNVEKVSGKLYYLEYEYSFNFKPLQPVDSTVALAYLSLDFDSETKLARQLWGYHLNILWKDKNLTPPPSIEGGLLFEDYEDYLQPGVGTRLIEPGDWETYFDENLSLVCFGDSIITDSTECVEFADGIIVALENHSIKALWLKPIIKKEP